MVNAQWSVLLVRILEKIFRKTGGMLLQGFGKLSHCICYKESSLITFMYRWIYCLILTIDANFRLKLKEKGNVADLALGNGWSHWVPREEFNAYVAAYGAVVEVRPLVPLFRLNSHYILFSLTIATPSFVLSIPHQETLATGRPPVQGHVCADVMA